MQYRSQAIALNSCNKLGGDIQMHYAVTSIERKAAFPEAEFGPGTGYAYWDEMANCGTNKKITKFHIFNSETCFGVQSMPTHNLRCVLGPVCVCGRVAATDGPNPKLFCTTPVRRGGAPSLTVVAAAGCPAAGCPAAGCLAAAALPLQ